MPVLLKNDLWQTDSSDEFVWRNPNYGFQRSGSIADGSDGPKTRAWAEAGESARFHEKAAGYQLCGSICWKMRIQTVGLLMTDKLNDDDYSLVLAGGVAKL